MNWLIDLFFILSKRNELNKGKMSSRRSLNSKEKDDHLSRFGQRLQSLSDSFYSTILEDSKDNRKIQIKNAKELEDINSNDFTFDQCSISQITSNDNFSFTFHSNDKSKQTKSSYENIFHSSTPYPIREDNLIKKRDEETIMVPDNRSSHQPIIVGYYPVISYQPVCLPPTIYFSKEQINDYSTLTKVTPIKKT